MVVLYFKTLIDIEVLLIAGSEGLYEVAVPGGADIPWRAERLLDREISDAVTVDLDGDGVEELVTIEGFHGDEIAADRLVRDIEFLREPLDRHAAERLEKRADALLSIALPHVQSPPPKRSWHRSGRHTTEARANYT